jgi:predicted short-subunit dehydrogenase-like oxidoreductase (DUF2520 family)
MTIRSATILGSGNVAFHLGKVLVQNGIPVDAVYSYNKDHAAALAKELHTKAFSDVTNLPLSSDLYIIAVKDGAIEEVSNRLPEVNGLVVHTSGNTSLDLLLKHNHRGVFYPLQTLSKYSEVNFAHVPILLESKQQEDLEILKQLADTIGAQSYEVDSDKRKVVHVAAVFANNFSNHLYGIAQQILTTNNLSFDMLKPLILETANKVQTHNPHEVQTGPAIRNDIQTMEMHLKLIEAMPQYKEIYEILSRGIQSKGDK